MDNVRCQLDWIGEFLEHQYSIIFGHVWEGISMENWLVGVGMYPLKGSLGTIL
jgi:hypothetical protein